VFLPVGTRPDFLSKVLSGVDRVERAVDDLFSPSTQRLIREAMLEEFGVREDDTELIVEAVE
jgi:hypothetical protein